MDQPAPMHVVAVAFHDSADAEAAHRELRRRLDVRDVDVGRRPLGGDPRSEGYDIILAGRFRENRLHLVHEVAASHRGEVIDDVLEEPAGPAAPMWTDYDARSADP